MLTDWEILRSYEGKQKCCTTAKAHTHSFLKSNNKTCGGAWPTIDHPCQGQTQCQTVR